MVTLRGEVDIASAPGLTEWLVEISASQLAVDLSEVTSMDSSGITVMVQAKNVLGDAIVLTRPQPNVERIFAVTGLTHWFADWDPAWARSRPATSQTAH